MRTFTRNQVTSTSPTCWPPVVALLPHSASICSRLPAGLCWQTFRFFGDHLSPHICLPYLLYPIRDLATFSPVLISSNRLTFRSILVRTLLVMFRMPTHLFVRSLFLITCSMRCFRVAAAAGVPFFSFTSFPSFFFSRTGPTTTKPLFLPPPLPTPEEEIRESKLSLSPGPFDRHFPLCVLAFDRDRFNSRTHTIETEMGLETKLLPIKTEFNFFQNFSSLPFATTNHPLISHFFRNVEPNICWQLILTSTPGRSEDSFFHNASGMLMSGIRLFRSQLTLISSPHCIVAVHHHCQRHWHYDHHLERCVCVCVCV